MKNNAKKLTTSIAVAAAVTGVSSTVHAAEPTTVEQPSVSSEKGEVNKIITEKDVNDAKDAMHQAQENANNADSNVVEAENNLNNAQNNTQQAEQDLYDAQNAHDNTTQEAIDKVQNDVNNAQNEVNQAEQEKNDAESAANDAQAEKDEAQNAVNNAQDVANNANSQSNSANQAVVDGEQAVADAENQVQANEQAVADAEKDVAGKEQSVNNAQNKVDEAVNADKESEKAKEDAKAELEKAKDEQVKKEQAEKAAQDEVNKQQSVVDEAVKETQQAKDNLANQGESKYPTTLDLSQEWLDAFKRWSNAQNADDKAKYKAELDALSETESTRLIKIFDDTVDLNKEQIYDANNLDIQMQNELNQYLATLLNSVHDALGDGKTVYANTNVIDFANKVSAEYLKIKNGFDIQHDLNAINTAAEAQGLIGYTNHNAYENLNLYATFSPLLSEFDLYRAVYTSLVAMFSGDVISNYGHAVGLLNSKNIGMSITSYEYDTGTGIPGDSIHEVHILTVDNYTLLNISGTKEERQAEYERLYGKNSSANLDIVKHDTSALQAAVNQAIDNEQTAKDKLAKLNEILTQAKSDVSDAITAVATAQSKYDSLVNSTSSQAQRELEQAKKELAESQSKLDTAVANLQASRDDLKGKQVALVSLKEDAAKAEDAKQQADQALDEAQAKLDSATKKSDDANKVLADARAKVEDAHAKLSAAQKVLDELTNTQANLEASQKAYDDTLAKQELAQSEYDKAIEDAKVAHDELEKATSYYNNLYSQYLVQQNTEGNISGEGNISERINNVSNINANSKFEDSNIDKVNLEITNLFNGVQSSKLPQTVETSKSMLSIIGTTLIGFVVTLIPFKRKGLK